MKKIATILLLALLIFNFVGYKLLFYALEQKANNNIIAAIDNMHYNDADLITVTVPLSMPYITDSKDFERKDGEITIDGKIYHYVKQKIFNGSLVLMCLPDEQKMNLQTAKNNFINLSNEFQNNTSSKKSGEGSQVLKLVISDYDKLHITLLNNFFSDQTTTSSVSNISFALLKGESMTPEQPPEV